MGRFSLEDATATFGFNRGDNPNRDIIIRKNATAEYVTTLDSIVPSSIITVISIPSFDESTIDTPMSTPIPAGSLITGVSLVWTEVTQINFPVPPNRFDITSNINFSIGTTTGGAEICAPAKSNVAGRDIVAGAVQSLDSIAVTPFPFEGSLYPAESFTFVNGAVRYFETDQLLFARTVFDNQTLKDPVNVTFIVDYITI